ncbi:dihydrofolate reductase family protein [Sinanaerobacter sp. ZZT-01]|uniref:dihydrofolate reductase family protein n=1 Tax=Sinanaerobacter sp. ZZT-01 TaxID=3111540 RepID=UPI002D787F6F|nr:dihydrofolate reductase family protein [Sinanaerobacter sp. ZZT-01]WRR93742.1 dihydrofolate reductase family protein [Sinanaerobacter sp. ZZT-01]
MRNIILYIAMSLDGYIADKLGGVGWLGGDNSDPENIGSYSTFIETIDTVILGYKTYQQIVTELSPDAWAYTGLKSYVLTHNKNNSTEEVIFTDKSLADLIAELKSENGKDVWICGGATIANQLINLDLIDRYHISVIPTILGEGIRLFDAHQKELKLQLISTQSYNGIVDLVYECRI